MAKQQESNVAVETPTADPFADLQPGVIEIDGEFFVLREDRTRKQYATREQAEQAWTDRQAIKGADITDAIDTLNRLVQGGPENARLVLAGSMVTAVAKSSLGSQRGRRNAGDQYREQQKAILDVDEEALRPILDDAIGIVEAIDAVNKAPKVQLFTLENAITKVPEPVYPATIVAAVKEIMLPSGKAVSLSHSKAILAAAVANK